MLIIKFVGALLTVVILILCELIAAFICFKVDVLFTVDLLYIIWGNISSGWL